MNTEREAFEEWHKSKYKGINYTWCDVRGYVHLRTHLDYEIWQASTAALQKRIEELEAAISKKDEALTNLLKEAKVLAILAHKHHAADCSYADVLPTGIGTWGCSCGLDSIVLDGELMNDFQYESALAIKAGNVQAPKEGWNVDAAKSLLISIYEKGMDENSYAEIKRLLPELENI